MKVLKVILFVTGVILGIISVFWLSGIAFMHLFNLPIEQSRPWLIIQYWQLYRHSSDKALRVASNLCLFLPWIGIAVALVKILEKKPRALHGEARFATDSEVAKSGLLNPKNGWDRTILVGQYKGKYLSYGGYQFVILAAPTRSGKGVGIVIPNCLNYSDSLVVLDIKGENFDVTSGFRKACGQKVFLFAPFDTNGETHRYNPLEYISEDVYERIGDIDSIATALYSGGNQNDKFWSENAKDLFRGLCLLVLETEGLPKTLGEILRQASGQGKPLKKYIYDKLRQAQDNKKPYSSACVDSLNRVLQNSDNTLAGIIATFNTPLIAFQNPRVDMATSANDFDLRQVRREHISIYFKITPDKLQDSGARVLVNLFFDQLLNLNTRTLPEQDPSLKYQCLVLLDEATSIGAIQTVKHAVSYMAGYNMRLLTIVQNKSQLEDVYGKAGALTILANHALMILYAPSPVVQSDAQEYSEMLGYQTVKAKSKSKGKGSTSENESDQRRALMLPQEMRELGQQNEIVSLENTKPIYCQKIRYYEDPKFIERANFKAKGEIRFPYPDVPKHDIKLFVAQIEQRVRDLTDEDADTVGIENALVGSSEIPEITDRISEDRIEEFVEITCEQVITHLLQQRPVNVEKVLKNRTEKTDLPTQSTEDSISEEDALEDLSALDTEDSDDKGSSTFISEEELPDPNTADTGLEAEPDYDPETSLNDENDDISSEDAEFNSLRAEIKEARKQTTNWSTY